MNVAYALNPLSQSRQVLPLMGGESLAQLAPQDCPYPFYCRHNDVPVLRADWPLMKVGAGDTVEFIALPPGLQGGGGGGGKNPLATVAMLAIMVFNPGMALLGAEGMGLSGMALKIGAMAVNAAIGMAVTALTMEPPRPTAAQQMQSLAAASPTYNLQAQGNQARLGQPVPEHFGRHVNFPDFGAEPYAEYVGNEQFLYQLFVVGQGYYDIEAIRIEDTAIASFPDITYEVVEPGGSVTLFPTAVVTSDEVAGQELTTGVYIGGFIANASGTEANALGIDVVYSRGLYYANSSGGLDSMSGTFDVEARPVDNAGAPTGAWALLGSTTTSGATTTPQRISVRFDVAPGRYEVRAKRTDSKSTDARAGHDLMWVGLRAYLPGTQQYGDKTLIAMRMRASNSLSAQSARRVNLIATRKLPAWDAISGWGAPAATRSIAWAFAYVARSANGLNYADDRLPLDELVALDATWTARGDTFDAIFDSKGTAWEALTQIARAGRAKPYPQGGILRIARDEPQSVPAAVYSMRNILPGSFSIEYTLPGDATADCIDVEYFNEDTWRPDRVMAALPGSASEKPGTLKLFGVVQRDQAWREGMFLAACNKYRRRAPDLQTELEGMIPSFLDLVAVQHDLPDWGQQAEATAWDEPTLTLTVSEPLSFAEAGTHYIGLRKDDGSFSGPWEVAAGADEFNLVLAELPDITPYTGFDQERTHVVFGLGSAYSKDCRLISAKYAGDMKIELSLVTEDARVHTADGGTITPTAPGWGLPGIPTLPVVTGLEVVQGGTPDRPILAASWRPAAGASGYLVERSADGVLWTRVGEVESTHLSFEVPPGTIHVRVAGKGAGLGPWDSWTDDAGTGVAPPPTVTGLVLAETFTGPVLRAVWDRAARALSYTVAIWNDGTLIRTREVALPEYSYTAEDAIADGLHGIGRDLEIRVRATGNGSTSPAWATLGVNNPQIGALTGVQVFSLLASLLVKYDMPAAPDFAGVCVWASDTDGFTPGSTNLKYRGPNNPVTIDVDPGTTWYLRIAGFDVWGDDSLTLSAQIDETSALIGADMIAAGTIVAGSAIIADGAITNVKIGDVIQSNSYVAGSSGWMINKDGTAEFRNITARGNIEATSLNAATGTFSGELSAATGTFSGVLLAGTGSPDVSLGVTYTYTASTTITVPAGYDRMAVRVIGGGGGGGGSQGNNFTANYKHGAGGAAGSSNSAILTVTAGQTYSLVIGAGGTGGTGGANNDATSGSAGGATAVTGYVSAAGGAGGAGMAIPRYTYDMGWTVTGAPTPGASSGFGAGGAAGANGESPSTGGTGGTAAGGGGAGSGGFGSNYGASGGVGGNGYAIVEFYQANAVVLRAEMVTLKAELTAQGHTLS